MEEKLVAALLDFIAWEIDSIAGDIYDNLVDVLPDEMKKEQTFFSETYFTIPLLQPLWNLYQHLIDSAIELREGK
jgi:hypothetical protein